MVPLAYGDQSDQCFALTRPQTTDIRACPREWITSHAFACVCCEQMLAAF
jgi:hypothetical protein